MICVESMSRGVIDSVSELILLQENRLRMESEDVISVLVQRINELHDALQASNKKLSEKSMQLNWVFAQYIEMKDKVLRNGQLGASNNVLENSKVRRVQSHNSDQRNLLTCKRSLGSINNSCPHIILLHYRHHSLR